MGKVAGTEGYEKDVDAFAEASFELKFADINKEFLEYLPKVPARALDVGCGVGQNAAALAEFGFQVVAVEPLNEFLSLAKSKFSGHGISWYNDHLPTLSQIPENIGRFDLVLADGVFHHLDEQEQRVSISRFAQLLNVGGVCTISLRNGPAGAGKHIFPTNSDALVKHANDLGLEVLLHLKRQPSKMKNKPKVHWDRIVLKKDTNANSTRFKSSKESPKANFQK